MSTVSDLEPDIHQERLEKKGSRELVLLNLAQAALAVVALAVAAWTLGVSRLRAGIDDLFLVAVCLLVALMASINPVLWLYRTGFFSVQDEAPAAADTHADAHAASNRLFVMVWVALLVLTALEVYLGYVQINQTLMLVIVMGASIVKAALIVAYFMHLRFERRSLILTVVPAVVVCIGLLLILFLDSHRITKLGQKQISASASTER